MKNKKFITELSRDLEKVYKDICKTYGLEINLGCRSYYVDLCSNKNKVIREAYQRALYKVLYLYIIRYVKSFRPRFYIPNRGTIMSYYTKKYFRTGYDLIAAYLPYRMWKNWEAILKEVKI